MAILYVAAEGLELEPFARYLTAARKLKWPLDYAYEGILDGRRILLAANGAGPKLAAHAVEVAIRSLSLAELSASKLEAVVSTGFCGALDPALRVNDMVLASAVLDGSTGENVACEMAHAAPEGFVTGVVLSQNRIARSSVEKQELFARQAVAVDMESSGVAARAARAGLPFYCIKVVSDSAAESFELDLNAMRTTEGRIARGKIVLYTLTHPQFLPGLFRLKRRATDAARHLGEFLVSCRITPESDNTPATG